MSNSHLKDRSISLKAKGLQRIQNTYRISTYFLQYCREYNRTTKIRRIIDMKATGIVRRIDD